MINVAIKEINLPTAFEIKKYHESMVIGFRITVAFQYRSVCCIQHGCRENDVPLGISVAAGMRNANPFDIRPSASCAWIHRPKKIVRTWLKWCVDVRAILCQTWQNITELIIRTERPRWWTPNGADTERGDVQIEIWERTITGLWTEFIYFALICSPDDRHCYNKPILDFHNSRN